MSAGLALPSVDVHTAIAVESSHPAVLLQPVVICGQLNESDRGESSREPGLGFEA
jgi:hypothetical protein